MAKLDTALTIHAGVKGINELKRLSDEIKATGTATDSLDKATDELQKSWNSLSADEQIKKVKALGDEFKHLKQIADAKIAVGLTDYQKTQSELDNLKKSFALLTSSGTLSKQELKIATAQYESKVKELNAELGKTPMQLSGLTKGISGLMASLGVGVGLSEIIQLSDEFNNLESRVRLATASGGDFNHAMASIREIADSTAMPLTATGELFGKLTQATRELGLSQNDVLGLTRTINQAMAVSGGSAQSMEAAITQLAQGLSSGALRGDEFNSVMEQSPRLATALADGLGVGIGQLKAMAGEGKLTAEVVSNALKSQANTIANEYAQMPKTVSGSLTVLKNTIMGFIGEMDNELQGSSGLAGFIDGISNSIKNIDPAMIQSVKDAFGSLGEIVKVLWEQLQLTGQTIQDVIHAFSGVSGASEQVSFLTRTVQGLAIATGVVADGFKGIQIVVQTVLGSVMREVGEVIDAFARITGESSELANSLMSKGNELLNSAKQNALEFESSAVTALDNAAKTQQQKLQETADKAKTAYEQMATDGKASTAQLEQAYIDYAQKAIAANKGVVDSTLQQELAQRNLQAVTDETGKTIVQAMTDAKGAVDELSLDDLKGKFKGISDTLKLDFDKATIGISQGFGELLQGVADLSAHYDDFTANGVSGTQLLIQALTTMKNTANNEQELIALADAWTDLGQRGQLSAEQLKAGLDGVNEKLDGIKEGINSVSEAYKTLGLTSQAQMQEQANSFKQAYDIIAKSGTATTQTLEDAFKKYAQAAIRANNGVADATLKAQAAERGLAIQINESGQATIVKKDELRQAVDKVANSTDRLAKSGTRAGVAMADGARAAKEEYDSLNKSIEDARKAQDARKANNSKGTTNQFGTKTGIEKFLKDAGLSEEEAKKGALQFEQQGKSFNQFDSSGKHLSTRLMEYAEKVRYSQSANKGGGGLSNSIRPKDIVNAFDERTMQQIRDEGGQIFANELLKEAKRRAK